MRQGNVVGTSPPSSASRVIQTLQAPPDAAPTSVAVRTASETSLRLRWVVSGEREGPQGAGRGRPRSPGVLSHSLLLVQTDLVIKPKSSAFHNWCWASGQPRPHH